MSQEMSAVQEAPYQNIFWGPPQPVAEYESQGQHVVLVFMPDFWQNITHGDLPLHVAETPQPMPIFLRMDGRDIQDVVVELNDELSGRGLPGLNGSRQAVADQLEGAYAHLASTYAPHRAMGTWKD
ncbi:MAG: hypothetical protein V1735_01330 [Nanoarchaeota archaeon]